MNGESSTNHRQDVDIISVDFFDDLPPQIASEALQDLEDRRLGIKPEPEPAATSGAESVDHEALWSLPRGLRLEVMQTGLPAGWEVHEWTESATFFYVHPQRRLKTWKRPTCGEDYDYEPFPTVAGRLAPKYFNPYELPPLPLEFHMTQDIGDNEDDAECPRSFEYPLQVYLVHSPIRGVKPLYRVMNTFSHTSKRAASAFRRYLPSLNRDHIKFRTIWLLLFILFWSLCWFFTTYALAWTLFWPAIISLYIMSWLVYPLRWWIDKFIVDPITTHIQHMALPSIGSMTLGSLAELGSDQAAWSHWKVLVSLIYIHTLRSSD